MLKSAFKLALAVAALLLDASVYVQGLQW